MHPSQCPFFQAEFESIRQELLDMPLQKLIFLTEEIMDQLKPVEQINYGINKFCSTFSDKHGRIDWILKLIEEGVLTGLQFPHNYYTNPRMVDLVKPQGYQMQFPFGRQDAVASDAALTDDMEMVSGPVTVTNPRWEHKDEAKKESSPAIAAFGDTVQLMADVSGIPEGASVTFDIYDTSEAPPMVVDSAKGKNEKGVVRGEWVVTDKSGKGEEVKLEFEAVAKSKASERCEIQLGISNEECVFTLLVDPDDPETYDDSVILKGLDTEYEQIKTVSDDKINDDGLFTVGFTDLAKGKKYQLIHDDGQKKHIVVEEFIYGN